MRLAVLFLAALVAAAPAATGSPVSRDAEPLRAVATARVPHDPGAFTQGLVFAGRRLFESTGLYGASTIRELDPATGRVLRRRALPSGLFAEGLAAVGDRLVQLTWREGRAEVWNVDTLRRVGAHRYTGEGWGLCYDGRRLVQSDGSARLTFRDPATFAARGGVVVTVSGSPRTLLGLSAGQVPALNELECRGGKVYANVWHADVILRIDPATGRVEAVIDASGLPRPRGDREDVLNGIAYDQARRAFVLTGKRWPWLYRVRFAPR